MMNSRKHYCNIVIVGSIVGVIGFVPGMAVGAATGAGVRAFIEMRKLKNRGASSHRTAVLS